MRFATSAWQAAKSCGAYTWRFETATGGGCPRLRQCGFDGFEVPLFQPAKVPAKEIRKALSANNLECTVCSILPAGMNPISDDPHIRRRTREHLVDSIKVTADLGSTLMGGPVYSPVGHLPGRRRTPDEWRRAVECFQSLGEPLHENGITLALEPLNRFETYFLNTAADAFTLCSEIGHSNVGVLLDTFHTNIEEKDVAAAFLKTANKLKHVHACENDRGIPGTGHVDFAGIAAALKQIGYDGWITIESFGYSHEELAAAAAIWRDLAPTPEAVAFDGLPFLKRSIQECSPAA